MLWVLTYALNIKQPAELQRRAQAFLKAMMQ